MRKCTLTFTFTSSPALRVRRGRAWPEIQLFRWMKMKKRCELCFQRPCTSLASHFAFESATFYIFFFTVNSSQGWSLYFEWIRNDWTSADPSRFRCTHHCYQRWPFCCSYYLRSCKQSTRAFPLRQLLCHRLVRFIVINSCSTWISKELHRLNMPTTWGIATYD